MSDAREEWASKAQRLIDEFVNLSIDAADEHPGTLLGRRLAEKAHSARATLLAHLRTAPAGYALVPVELPDDGSWPEPARDLYRTMLAAAPTLSITDDKK